MAFLSADFDTFIRLGVEALLNGLWQGLALAALVWCLLRLIRGLNATTRYFVWGMTLLAVVSLPLLHGLRAAYAVRAAEEAATSTASAAVVESSAADEGGALLAAAETSAGVDAAQAARASADAEAFAARPAAATFSIRLFSGYWSGALLAAWLLVAGWKAAQVLRSHRGLQALKRACAPLGEEHQRLLRGLLEAYNVKRPVRLLASRAVKTPMAVGLNAPAIIIPADLVGQLTEAELTQVVLHELAHIRRWDDWTNFGQKMAEAVFFFFPAVMLIRRRMNLEREVACDDWVISVTGANRPYAACLTKLLELAVAPRRHSLAPGALVGGSQISRRVELLLRKQRSVSSRLSPAGLLLPSSALVVAVMLFAQVAPLVAVLARPEAAQAHAAEPRRDMTGLDEGNSAVFNAAATGAEAATGTSGAVRRAETAGARTLVAKSEASAGEQPSEAGRDSLNASADGVRGVVTPPSTSNVAPVGPEAAAVAHAAEPVGRAESLAQQVKAMTSNGEKAAALIGFIESQPRVSKLPDGFFEAFATITSGGEQRRVLTTLLGKRPSREVFLRTLAAVSKINSDGEKAAVLAQAAKVCPNDEAVISAYLKAVGAIGSSHEKERSLAALLQRNDLSRVTLVRTLEVARNQIGSQQARQNISAPLEARLAQ
jgi:beta-lactamase regulating signal transducer with metallopeptidase domain